MAVGNSAIAAAINSFAFGEDAKAEAAESYAFGRGAIASGYRSFAFGSAGVDSSGVSTAVSQAKGDYSFSIGQGSITGVDYDDAPPVNPRTGLTQQEFYDLYYSGKGALAIGMGDSSLASYATTIGYFNTAKYGGVALGYQNKSYGSYATISGGNNNIINGSSSVIAGGHENKIDASYAVISGGINNTINADAPWGVIVGGTRNEVNGSTSTVLSGTYNTTIGSLSTVLSGSRNVAYSYAETVLGMYNDYNIESDSKNWLSVDPLFVIGNGFSDDFRSNALVVYKNGNMDVNGNLKLIGKMGVNVETPATTFHVQHEIGLRDGLSISSKTSGRWHFHVTESNNMCLYFNNTEVGSFDPETGQYYTVMMPYKTKTNSKPAGLMLNKIMNLKITNYNTKDSESKERIGIDAESIENQLPFLVEKRNDIVSINYAAVGAVAIKAIQEQQELIQNQNKKIETLEQQLEELKQMILQLSK